MLFNKNTIRDRVLAHVFERIERAQKLCTERIAALQSKHYQKVKELELRLEEDKEEVINELVGDVLNNK